jgi:photosystem II stability/assembly factor-like uncharacterized protein
MMSFHTFPVFSKEVFMKSWGIALKTVLAILSVLVLTSSSSAEEIDTNIYKALTYRHIGPQGNRTSAVVGVPGNTNICYAGASSGGVWKSTDGGVNWEPIFDDQPAQSIGSIAIAPSDPNVVWVGTGETFIRSNVSIGNGIYKSIDGGKTWEHMGLTKTGRIGRILVDPRDPDVVFAAAVGHAYGPQPERGVFRTKDGGKTWEKVLFVDEHTGASDIAMDPTNPRILFAGTWEIDIKTWGRMSGGPGSGVFMSRDGGDTWKRLTNGLPESPLGKIAVNVAPSDPDRVYALIETGQRGSLWRSDDGGFNWKLVSHDRLLNERPHYYTRMAVAPDNYNEVYFPSNSLSVTYDGGETTSLVPRERGFGGDNHDMWIDPLNPDRMMIGNDGGVSISVNHGLTWHRVILPIAQIYHVAVDSQIPYFVYGNRQDGPSYRGPSNALTGTGYWGGGIPSGMWLTVSGCESGFAIPDPVDNNIVWGGCYNAGLDVWNLKTRHNRSVRVWPKSPMGSPAGLLKYRFNWTFPIAISPHDHNKVYVGSQVVHQTTDGGQSWTDISPDLSLNDVEHLQDSGGLTRDNLGVEYGDLVFAIAESPLEAGLIWAGTNDGQVQVTRDGGQNWTNVTENISGMPALMTVSNIDPSRYDAGTCYIAVDGHQVNNRDPWIYKTTDYGQTWKLLSDGIPKSVLSYTHCVREDPKRKGLLYAGTENALYISFNDGADWVPFNNNMPHAPVHWMVVQEHFNDLVVATYGRGFWIMDDVTPLQQLNDDVLAADVHLFDPRPAYRFRTQTRIQDYPNDQCTGQSPRYGASINYRLSSPPEGDVQIAIEDSTGKTIRTFKGTKNAGINRVYWDLRHEPPKEARLRVKPPGNPNVWYSDRFKEYTRQGYIPLISWGIGSGLSGPLAVPGTYTVKLTVGEKVLSASVEVRKDPSSEGTLEDIRKQVATALSIEADMNTVVDSVNRIEWIRKQIHDLIDVMEAQSGDESLIAAAKELDEKIVAVESHYFQPILAEGDLKSFRAPNQLYSQLAILEGDVANDSADFPPTTQMLAVHEELQGELKAAEDQLQGLLSSDIPAFNDLIGSKGISTIVMQPTE